MIMNKSLIAYSCLAHTFNFSLLSKASEGRLLHIGTLFRWLSLFDSESWMLPSCRKVIFKRWDGVLWSTQCQVAAVSSGPVSFACLTVARTCNVSTDPWQHQGRCVQCKPCIKPNQTKKWYAINNRSLINIYFSREKGGTSVASGNKRIATYAQDNVVVFFVEFLYC